jgi:decaprenyl-diphosphate synthase subunit 2
MMKILFFREQGCLENVMESMKNHIEAEFIGDRDDQNFPLPSDPQFEIQFTSASDEWNQRNFLSTGSTLATFSKWSINFSGASEKHQNSAYEFGKNYALLVNAFIQTLPFIESHDKNSKFCLVSAPVLFQLEDTPELYDKFIKDRKSIEDIDFDELYHLIVNGRGIEKSLNLIKNLRNDSMNSLNMFTNSDAKIALENLVTTIHNIIK